MHTYTMKTCLKETKRKRRTMREKNEYKRKIIPAAPKYRERKRDKEEKKNKNRKIVHSLKYLTVYKYFYILPTHKPLFI